MLNGIKKINMQQIFIWMLVVLIPILRSTYTIDPDIYLKFIFLSVLLFIFIVYKIGTEKTHPLYSNFKNPVIIALVSFLSYSIISFLISNNKTDGIFEWYMSFINIVLVLVMILYFPLETLKKELPKAFTLLSLILIISGFVDLIPLIKQGNISVPADTYSVVGLYGHRNLYSQMLFFTFPYSIFAALFSKEKIWRVLGSISSSALLFFLIILSNRATWIALAIGIFSLLFFHVYFYYKKNRNISFAFNRHDYKKIILLMLTMTFFTILFYIHYSNVSSIKSHTGDIIDFNKGSTKDHLILWQKTLNIIKEKPILGSGLSTWKFEILKYGNQGLVSENNSTFYQTPHNDFLWVCSEQGLIGLIIYVLIFILLLYILIENISLSENKQDFLFNNLTLFMFIGYFIYSVFSFPKERVESNIIFSIIVGVALVKKSNADKNNIFSRANLLVYSALLLILFGLFIVVSRFKAEIYLEKALYAKAENNFPVVVEEIKKASGIFYKTDPTSTPLAWYSGSALYNMARYNDALIEFQTAYRINPYHVHVLNNLASCYEMLGNHKSAIEYYQKAAAVAPNFEDAWLNMCAIYFNQKQFNEAYDALNRISLSTQNPKFKPFLSAVLKSKIQQALSSQENSKFQTEFIENISNEDWFLKIHQYLQTNNMTIETYIKEFPVN